MLFIRKNKNEFRKSFNFFEPQDVTWRYLLSGLNKNGWLTDIEAVRKNAKVVLIKVNGSAIHAEIVSYVENECVEFSIKRKEIGSQQFLFQVVANKKSSCILNVKTKIDFESSHIDQSSARSKLKNNLFNIAAELEKSMRDEMEVDGLRSWF